jgi:putative sugar O-methyltransferase
MSIKNLTKRVFFKGARGLSKFNLPTLSNLSYRVGLIFGPDANAYSSVAKNYLKQKKYKQAALTYKKAIKLAPNTPTVFDFGDLMGSKDGLKSELFDALISVVETKELRQMLISLSESPSIYQPSKFWINYMIYNIYQIEACGIENFKRSVNNNYHTFLYESGKDPLYISVKQKLGWSDSDIKEAEKKLNLDKSVKPIEFTDTNWSNYKQFLIMLWEVAVKNDKLKLLQNQGEPLLGNPFTIEYKGNLVTQDICQTVLEVNTIIETIQYDSKSRLKVMELGAGHGRIGNVLLNAFPNSQVVIIDIPPALFVSQWYLTNLFPTKKAFKFRDFSSYEEIKEEFESADIAFLSPPQIEFIQDKYFDLFINVCSLMEMKPIQIENWFKHIDRVCNGWFYTKQWHESKNPQDNVVIYEKDYPERSNWNKILNRTSIHPLLFESLYKIN